MNRIDRAAGQMWLSRWLICAVLFCALVPVLSGCGGDNRGKGARNHVAGAKVDPDDLTGRWKLSVANQGAQVDIGLIQIDHDPKANPNFSVSLLGLPPGVNADVKNIKIDTENGSVAFDTEFPNGIVAGFSGRLDGDSIWGSYWVPHFQLVPSKLERTELDKLEKVESTPASHLEDFMKARNAKDSYIAMDTLAEKANRSPLLFEIYPQIATHFKDEKFTQEKVEEFAEKYRKAVEIWGDRMAPIVDLDLAYALAKQNLFPDLAKKHLAAVEAKLTEDHPLELKTKILETGILLGDVDKALKQLPKLEEQEPTNPYLIWLHARALEKASQQDAAMREYARVMVIPGYQQQLVQQGTLDLELPSQSAVRLWKAKHENSTDGFEDFARTAYVEVMKKFVPERTPEKRESNSKVPLVELFTSSFAVPCIAADVAMESLHASYSGQEAVVLKYYQHNPFVDPLANESDMKRSAYYGVSETPSMVFNGEVYPAQVGIPVATGSLQLLAGLRGMIEGESKTVSLVSIQLKAERQGDEVTVNADVSGITSVEHQPRLYLAIVENDIYMPGRNGILMHNCVVRGFAGGIKGLAVPKGKSSHVEKFSVKELRRDLESHLAQFEKEQQLYRKPLDLKKLQIVAFVQPSFTKVVLQSAITDVTGDVPPDEPQPAESKPAETKPGETKPGETKPGENKPGEPKTSEAKPTEPKPTEEKTEPAKPDASKSDTPKSDTPKSDEGKPEEAKPAETKPEPAKPEEPKADAPKAEEKPTTEEKT